MGGSPFSGMKLQPSSIPNSPSIEYASKALRILMEDFNHLSEAFVLDMGPVCGENITLIANRVNKLFVCDMYFHFANSGCKEAFGAAPHTHMNYPENSFDVIFFWDLIERLGNLEAKRLAECCFLTAKPGAMIIATSMGKETVGDTVHSFVMGNDYDIKLRRQPHLSLLTHPRPIRDIITLMDPFELVKSFVYRNGIRELLFKRN